ncbi:MAG: hypothetical protein ACI9P7_000023 [Candidatus Azotimanducaceae bacterium]|jgi:hypothetical protein
MVLGIALLLINLVGLSTSLRPAVVSDAEFLFEQDLTLDFESAFVRLQRFPDQDDGAFVKNAVVVISQAIGHGWPVEQSKAFHLTVPLTENYLLFTLAHVGPAIQWATNIPVGDVYRNYEFYNWRKALERGVGLCSQHAIILDGVLQRAGIDARIVRLEGHVLNEVTLRESGDIWLADADYGLTIPLSLKEAELNTPIVKGFYEQTISDVVLLDELAKVYGEEGNELLSSAGDYLGGPYVFIETASYLLKWLLPLLLLVGGATVLRYKASHQAVKPDQ